MSPQPGRPFPLGATWDGRGTNFALFSAHATAVELCLFDTDAQTAPSHTIQLPAPTDQVWHIYMPDVRPGQLYAYRVQGPSDPDAGHRFDPDVLLLDPYAKAVGRSTPSPLGIVVDPTFHWGGDQPPQRPWADTVIYEMHVKGFSALNMQLPKRLRGTYAGLASDASTRHLLDLGITAVELMPVHQHFDELPLQDRGLTNYWGYNTLSFFAPDTRFATSPADAVREFKRMVKALHAAGLEVILDVVYNHTAEGNHLGPTLSWRGVDNASYYRLVPGDAAFYEDFTGCGNTLNMQSPYVLQLVMDSLRYWVEDMHVDGFRFDLATALARTDRGYDRQAPFLDVIHQDPVLSRVKLIAEPWDVGEGGYQIGNFPAGWSEWNGKYRDAIRRFWRGDAGMLPELATRLSGSSDLYAAGGRTPQASVNFVTSHDGFTLADLVTYQDKHNEANGEENRDGESNNLNWNCGVEGPTDDQDIIALRERQRRNHLVTLMLSMGIPMISGGDEVGRTQLGNNNAYCHDSPLSWTPWGLDDSGRALLDFVRRLAAIRTAHAPLTRRTFLDGRQAQTADVHWLRGDGQEMTEADWSDAEQRVLGMALHDEISGNTLLVILNAAPNDVEFQLHPTAGGDRTWTRLLDTARPGIEEAAFPTGSTCSLLARSAQVLQSTAPPVV